MPPNPNCIVCSSKPQVVIKIDTNRVTVKQFRDDVLVKSLNMVDPDVIAEMKGLVLISSEEGETECNNNKLLADLEIVDGCILKVDDFFQNYELTVVIAHKDIEREGDLFEIIADPEALKADNQKSTVEQGNGEPKAKKPRHDDNNKKEDSDDDLCLIEDDEMNAPNASTAAASSNQAMDEDDDDDDEDCSILNETEEEIIVQKVDAPTTSSLKRSRVADDDDDDIILIED